MKQLIHDEGINQYSAVKAAYDRAKAVLTQENPDRKELSDLLDVLDMNPKGVEWLKAEKNEEYDALYKSIEAIGKEEKLKTMCKRSYSIIEGIEGEFRREEGLYRACLDAREDTHTNLHAAMAILYSILGNGRKAENILSKFEEKIQNRARLYRHSDKGEAIMTADNALMAAAYAAIGNRQRADEIFYAIESKCKKLPDSFYDDVICGISEPHDLNIKPNAAMGIAHRVIGNDSRANAIIPALDMFRAEESMLYENSMKYPLVRNQGLYEVERRFVNTHTNALMAFAHLISGGYESAQMILEEIEEKKDMRTEFYSSILRGNVTFQIGKPHVWANDNALMAIAYALMDGAKLCGLPKREKP